VTGSHAVKDGVQWHIGQTWNTADANADLVQRYRDGVPDSVIVYNTPTRLYALMGADLGIYLQDSWTLKRLTINPGIRFEYFNSSAQAKAVEAGRFVPARSFPEIANIPNWMNLAPRLGVVYDLTGDAKTAIKASVNKYNLKHFLAGVRDGDLGTAALWQANIGRSLSLGDFTAVNLARTELGALPVDAALCLKMVETIMKNHDRIRRLSVDPLRTALAASTLDDEVGLVWSLPSPEG